MAEGEFDYINTVRLLMNNNKVSDSDIQTYLRMVEQSILNYCNIDELPSALNYTLCSMCALVYNDTLNDIENAKVSKVAEDGREVTFTTNSVQDKINDRIAHTRELNRFKKLYKI